MDEKTIDKNSALLRKTFIGIGAFIIIFSLCMLLDYEILYNHRKFTTGYVENFKACHRSYKNITTPFLPCYEARVSYTVNGKTYKASGPRIFQNIEEIRVKKYSVIYQSNKPSHSLVDVDSNVNHLRFHATPISLSAFGLLFVSFGIFGESTIKKSYRKSNSHET